MNYFIYFFCINVMIFMCYNIAKTHYLTPRNFRIPCQITEIFCIKCFSTFSYKDQLHTYSTKRKHSLRTIQKIVCTENITSLPLY